MIFAFTDRPFAMKPSLIEGFKYVRPYFNFETTCLNRNTLLQSLSIIVFSSQNQRGTLRSIQLVSCLE